VGVGIDKAREEDFAGGIDTGGKVARRGAERGEEVRIGCNSNNTTVMTDGKRGRALKDVQTRLVFATGNTAAVFADSNDLGCMLNKKLVFGSCHLWLV